MKIKICTTDDFSSKEWNSYQNSFNAVFDIYGLRVFHYEKKY